MRLCRFLLSGTRKTDRDPSAEVKVIDGESIGSLVTVPLASYEPEFFHGQTIQLFANGLGPVNNQPDSGIPAPSQPLATTAATPTVTIGSQNATVTSSGLARGFTGLYQVNATAPAGIQPVILTIGGVSSKTASSAVQ
jgi:uncharacterized protein (TIGR03437 family)